MLNPLLTPFEKVRLKQKALELVRLRRLHKPADWHPDRYALNWSLAVDEIVRETGAPHQKVVDALNRAISQAAQKREHVKRPRRRLRRIS